MIVNSSRHIIIYQINKHKMNSYILIACLRSFPNFPTRIEIINMTVRASSEENAKIIFRNEMINNEEIKLHIRDIIRDDKGLFYQFAKEIDLNEDTFTKFCESKISTSELDIKDEQKNNFLREFVKIKFEKWLETVDIKITAKI